MTNVLLALQSSFDSTQIEQLLQLFNNQTMINLPLDNGKILIGDASNLASQVTVSGDITLSNTGVSTFRNMSGLSVLGNATAIAATPTDIVASAADQVLRINTVGTAMAWGAINLASSNAVSGLLGYVNGGSNSNVSFTQNSIIFAGATGFAQNNANLAWNDSTTTFSVNGVTLKSDATTKNAQFSRGGLATLTTGIENTLFGDSSGVSITSGNYNVLVGKNAGTLIATSQGSTAIGSYSLAAMVSSSGNVAVGYTTFLAATTGGNGVAIGFAAASKTTTINGLTIIGGNAGLENTTGIRNTYIGLSAGQRNTTGQDNVYVGYLSGAGSSTIGNAANSGNVGIGFQAATFMTTGSNNMAIGRNSMNGTQAAGITGSDNTAIGNNTLSAITSANDNSIFGSGAATAITTGSNNIVIGFQSGTSITTGSQQLIIGYNINTTTATGTGFMSIGNAIFGTTITGTGTTISTGNIGIFVAAPTARLHVIAGTAAANTAPIKLTSGTNLTIPENGAMEYDGTNLFFTRTGAVRETVITGVVTTAAATLDSTKYVTTNIAGVAVKLAMIV